jgi:hypothetical protein
MSRIISFLYLQTTFCCSVFVVGAAVAVVIMILLMANFKYYSPKSKVKFNT